MIFLSEITIPSMPIASIHQLIWKLFDVPDESDRPFVYRSQGSGRYLILSRLRPRNACWSMETPGAGQTVTFEVEACVEKWVGTRLKYERPRGSSDDRRGRRPVVDNAELQEWIRARLEGAEVPFVHAFNRAPLQLRHHRHGDQKFHRTRFVGTAHVTDRAAFERTLLRGAGRGKYTGLGLIYLPDLMARPATLERNA
jgi:CRISPR-associated protein Cas6/Cse3/CasE subtype I-E